MKFILGTKKEMTQIFNDNGDCIPVTVVNAGPCIITQIKTKESDKYDAVQIGYGEKKKVGKTLRGHYKKIGDECNCRHLKEMRDKKMNSAGIDNIKIGDIFGVEIFNEGDIVKVIGNSKGKGFQGVVKRHGFHGSPASHGHKDQLRMPGSIGATAPAHVFKGKRMAGRMGGGSITMSNLKIIKVDKEKNLLYIKGAVTGARNGLLQVKGDGEMKVRKSDIKNT
ncbi:50S ribosomal protein L3 [Patescibacteria group bacterium]